MIYEFFITHLNCFPLYAIIKLRGDARFLRHMYAPEASAKLLLKGVLFMDCIFCKIINGDIPSTKVYEDDNVLAFNDLNPIAPVHVLIIPKTHIESANAVDENNSLAVAKLFEKIPVIAKKLNLTNGYRVITNCGSDGGQSVLHLHFHLLGGKQLPW
jgi:Diadenosine tetraphosphate (Ap4A) hydrolase and other HIT family hydrolases